MRGELQGNAPAWAKRIRRRHAQAHVPLDASLLKALKVLPPARVGNLPAVGQGAQRQTPGLLCPLPQGMAQCLGHLKRRCAVQAQGPGLPGGVLHGMAHALGLLADGLHLGGQGLSLLHHITHLGAGTAGVLKHIGQRCAGAGGLRKAQALGQPGQGPLHVAVVGGSKMACKDGQGYLRQAASGGKAVPLGIEPAGLPAEGCKLRSRQAAAGLQEVRRLAGRCKLTGKAGHRQGQGTTGHQGRAGRSRSLRIQHPAKAGHRSRRQTAPGAHCRGVDPGARHKLQGHAPAGAAGGGGQSQANAPARIRH